MSSHKISKNALFDDDDDDEVEILEEEQQPQNGEEFDLQLDRKLGKNERKTAKLIELQSKFAYDSRFKIDDRFVDDEDDEEDDEQPKTEIEEEKSKNFAILEQVLGKKIHHTKPVDAVTEFRKSQQQQNKGFSAKTPASTTISVLTPRFDPTKEETKIYEIAPPEEVVQKRKIINIDFDELDRIEEKTKKKKAKNAASTPTVNGNATKPTAEEQPYYEVNTNLKSSFASGEEFTFGSLFGLNAEPSEAAKAASKANETATAEPISSKEKKRAKKMPNPFRYDSSDDDEGDDAGGIKWNDQDDEEEEEQNGGIEDEEMEDEEEVDNVQIKIGHSSFPPPPKAPMSFGGFFFRSDADVRLKEDPFYTTERVQHDQATAKERQLTMMRALSLRKRAAQKNVKSNQKFVAKLKLKQARSRKSGHRRKHLYASRFANKNRSSGSNTNFSQRNGGYRPLEANNTTATGKANHQKAIPSKSTTTAAPKL